MIRTLSLISTIEPPDDGQSSFSNANFSKAFDSSRFQSSLRPLTILHRERSDAIELKLSSNPAEKSATRNFVAPPLSP